MFAKDIVEYDILPLRLNTSLEAATQAAINYKANELPVIDDNDEFAGIVFESDILDSVHTGNIKTIKDIPLSMIHVSPSHHVYEVFEVMSINNLSILPVVDVKNTLLGTISLHNLASFLAGAIGMKQQGAVFIVKTKPSDYSMSQICHIIESNNAKIISISATDKATDETEITIKVNTLDVTSITQSFNRFNYSVDTLNAKTDIFNIMIKSRIDNLLNFINM